MSKIKHIALAALLVVSTFAYAKAGDISGGKTASVSLSGTITGGRSGDITGGKYVADVLLVLVSLAQ
jgi:hypothetical protein